MARAISSPISFSPLALMVPTWAISSVVLIILARDLSTCTGQQGIMLKKLSAFCGCGGLCQWGHDRHDHIERTAPHCQPCVATAAASCSCSYCCAQYASGAPPSASWSPLPQGHPCHGSITRCVTAADKPPAATNKSLFRPVPGACP
jgi:hypothetical protein